MNNFVDYDYYKNTYGGTSVPSSIFARLSLRASYKVNNYTMGRAEKLENLTDEIKLATCSIIDKMYSIEEDGGVKVAETVGKHSVTYADTSNNTTEDKLYYRIALTYLANTGLLYRGLLYRGVR